MNGGSGIAFRKRRAVILMGKHKQPKVLYSIYRNSDDALLVFDKSAEYCCEFLGITQRSFYERLSRTGGDWEKFTIRKIAYEDAMRESEA